ncbi:MAG: NADH-quinone oxidoreductase subunit M [Bacillus sp. (in: firmicutes)]
MTELLLLLLVFSPGVGMLLLVFVPKQQEKVIKFIGFLATLPAFLIALSIFLRNRHHSSLSGYSFQMDWFRLGNFKDYDSLLYDVKFELGIDGFSLVMLLLTSLLAMLSAIASQQIKKAWKEYFLLFLLLEIGMLGVFAAENLVLFFLFFEVTLVAMFFLIGKWGGVEKEQAAYRFLVYNGLGSAILLIVIMVLFAKTGSSNIDVLQQIVLNGGVTTGSYLSEQLKLGLLIALLIAFGIKLPVLPLHSWMLAVHVQAPPAIVMLHAGVLLKIGAYGFIRFGIGIFPEQFQKVSFIIVILGVVNLLYGAFLALIQQDFKRVLAYSSVSHMGMVLIGLGVLNEAGIQGAIFQVVSHGLIAAMLFYLVGLLYERTRTSQLEQLGGMAKATPILAGFLLAAGMASLGLPGLSGFISEFMVFLGLFQEKPVIGAISAIGLIVTAVYVLRAVLSITYGESKHEGKQEFVDIRATEWPPLLLLFGAIVLIGVYPAILIEPLNETLKSILLRIGG